MINFDDIKDIIENYRYKTVLNIEYWLLKHFVSYHFQGIPQWCYGRLYIIIQFFTPFLKWSRWCLNQCGLCYGKLITDYGYKFSKRYKDNYLEFSIFFGKLTITKITYLDSDGEKCSLKSAIADAFLNNEYKIKNNREVIYSKWIFTKKQALSAIQKIKTFDFEWDSCYGNLPTYWIEEFEHRNCQYDDELFKFMIYDIKDCIRITNDEYIKKHYDNIDQANIYSVDNMSDILLIMNRLKEIGYYIKRKDFWIL